MMRTLVIVFFCATVLVAAIVASSETTDTDPEACVAHDDNSDTPNPCEGKNKVRDRTNEVTYCCASSGRRPIGHKSVSVTDGYEYHCRCATNAEYCKKFPMFCLG